MMLSAGQSSNDNTTKKHVIADDRTQCPICLLDVANLPGRTSLTKHIASHLEKFSLDCLPLNTSSWGNENVQDNEMESSDPDQDLLTESHEHTVRNELETVIEEWEAEANRGTEVEESILIVDREEARSDETGHSETHESHRREAEEDGLPQTIEEEYERRAHELKLLKEQEDLAIAVRVRNRQKRSRHLVDEAQERWAQRTDAMVNNEREMKQGHTTETPTEQEEVTGHFGAREQSTEGDLAVIRKRQYSRLKHELMDEAHESEEGREELDEAMRKRLGESGFETQQIDAIMDYDKGKQQSTPEILAEQEAATGSLGTQVRPIEGDPAMRDRIWAVVGMSQQMRTDMEDTKAELIDPDVRYEVGSKHWAELHSEIQQIAASVNQKKEKETEKQQSTPKTPTTATATSAGVPLRSTAPVYPKIHSDYIATETLRYYDIPWEYDKVSKT